MQSLSNTASLVLLDTAGTFTLAHIDFAASLYSTKNSTIVYTMLEESTLIFRWLQEDIMFGGLTQCADIYGNVTKIYTGIEN